MSCEDSKQNIRINISNAVCPIGETTGKKNIRESMIPVLRPVLP